MVRHTYNFKRCLKLFVNILVPSTYLFLDSRHVCAARVDHRRFNVQRSTFNVSTFQRFNKIYKMCECVLKLQALLPRKNFSVSCSDFIGTKQQFEKPLVTQFVSDIQCTFRCTNAIGSNQACNKIRRGYAFGPHNH